jgi:hypothetical protein
MKTLFKSALLFCIIFCSCKTDSPSEPVLTDLSGPYLGQTLPGVNPVRFAPSNLFIASSSTWWYHGSPVFSPDGNEMYFVKYMANHSGTQIWYTRIVEGNWIVPQKASFSVGDFPNNPMFSESNDTLYFYSNMHGGFIHRVTRTVSGWSEPVTLNIPLPSNIGIGLQFSIAKNKSIYFELSANSGSSPSDIYVTKIVNGHYTLPVSIGSPINTTIAEMVGCVDPEERFMIYCSKKEGGYGYHDMYISYRNIDGSWGNPINLGSTFNSPSEEVGPVLTPDGKYLFFISEKSGDDGYTPYWVDINAIVSVK